MLQEPEIWLDVNIAPIIAKWLQDALGLNIKSSYVLKLQGPTDLEVYNKAKRAGQVIIISKDADLANLVKQFGAPPRVIELKIGNTDNRILFQLLHRILERCVRMLTQFNLDSLQLDFEL